MADDFDFSKLVATDAEWPGPVTSEAKRAVKQAQDRRRRERFRANGPVERFSGSEIGERDGWICGLCLDSIEPERKCPDPRSPSVDHIVPPGEGGTDTRSNVRITHLWCNLSRNAYSEQTIERAQRFRAWMIEKSPERRDEIEARFVPEEMVRRSRERHSPDAYRARLARRVARFERVGR